MRPRKIAPLIAAAGLLAGCGSAADPEGAPPAVAAPQTAKAAAPPCRPNVYRRLVTRRNAYAVVVPRAAVAHRRPNGPVLARFGPRNVNGAPTVFGVLGARGSEQCRERWLHVQLPIKPNGITGYVRARDVRMLRVPTRIEIDISERRVTLLRGGKPVMRVIAAVGSSATPTPTGRYYVNQRLLTDDVTGPFGPGAIGISAYSEVLTGWTQGGPIAIHGTNQPDSIGRPVSNGCLRVPNPVLRKMMAATVTGTPVVIRA